MLRNVTYFYVGLVVLRLAGSVTAAEAVLPQGSAPPALSSPYFPDRIHEFIWRNWTVVSPAKLATLLGTSVDNVTSIATSMGLPAAAQVSPEFKERGYSTVIRRNWHLLPYDQLLELLEMTPERLATILREEDTLYIKLGSLKPKCEPLRYRAPDEAAKQRAQEILRVVQADFGDELELPAEPRFDFVRQLSTPSKQITSSSPQVEQDDFLRLVYSYVAVYGDPLINPEPDPYPDAFLQRLASVGVNGVWLHAVLRDLAPGGDAFPEFGAGHEQRLSNLRVLVERAKKHGIGVYLYLNEPRAMPGSFFDLREHMAGVQEGEFTALCTTSPDVRKWMGDALAHVFREVPNLAGIYAITASENLTSCASHGQWQECSRCKHRKKAEVLAEVTAVLEEGVHRSSPAARVIISDWGWSPWGRSSEFSRDSPSAAPTTTAYMAEGPEVISRLPGSVSLMSVSEWHVPIERGGIKSDVGEYSISAVGPGPRALRHWSAAHDAGLKTAAEVQFNNTCEIASLPYVPVMDLVAEHCHNLAAAHLSGMLIGWTQGGYPSPNFQLAQSFSRAPAPDVDTALNELSLDRFGSDGAPHARTAWTLLSKAYQEYPFHIAVVYNSPVQCGPANPLYRANTHYSSSVWGIPYDHLEGWRGIYPREIFAAQFEKMAQGWQPGIVELEQAVDKTPAEKKHEALADLRYARAAGISFQSVANQAYFIIARDALADGTRVQSEEERRRLQQELTGRLESEIRLAREMFTLTREDSRIGFEPACQYFYLPLDLVEKVINCRWLLKNYAQSAEAP